MNNRVDRLPEYQDLAPDGVDIVKRNDSFEETIRAGKSEYPPSFVGRVLYLDGATPLGWEPNYPSSVVLTAEDCYPSHTSLLAFESFAKLLDREPFLIHAIFPKGIDVAALVLQVLAEWAIGRGLDQLIDALRSRRARALVDQVRSGTEFGAHGATIHLTLDDSGRKYHVRIDNYPEDTEGLSESTILQLKSEIISLAESQLYFTYSPSGRKYIKSNESEFFDLRV